MSLLKGWNDVRKKKIGIMTFHYAHNYGAMLQAYALESVINNLECDCEVLDYRLEYIDNWSGIHYFNDLICKYGFIPGSLRYIRRRLFGYYRNITIKRLVFDDFMRHTIKLSKCVYFKPGNLKKSNYDCIVFGSDQIWNPDLTNGIALEYFGKYFNENVELVSYAASCGKDYFISDLKDTILPLLKRFKSISVRERGLCDFIATEYNLPVSTVLDPVFLLPNKKWSVIADKSHKPDFGNYLLLYAFQVGPDIYNLARRIAKERSLKIVSIVYSKSDDSEDIIQLTDCSPSDFLFLIKNANFICTSSFHGMAFSIIFEKDFYCMGHPLYSTRNTDLLNRLHLEDRFIQSEWTTIEIKNCAYSLAREILQQEIQNSKNFLIEALEVSEQNYEDKNEQH